MWCCARTPKSAHIIRRFEISYLSPLAGRGRSRRLRVRGTIRESRSLRRPLTPTLSPQARGEGVSTYATAGTGNAVTDLIFSIAKREVTFFSGTAPISFL